jgi:hypothetical protein
MHRLSYVIAAFTVIALVSPSLAEDAPKAGQTAKTERSSPAGGEARHEGGKIGGSGDRAGMPAETGKGGPGWHGARAEQVVVGDRRHHHHRHHHHAM